MFLGEYQAKFTGNGRVVIPAKIREELGGEHKIVLSRGLDGCIWGFDLNRWQEQSQKQLETPTVESEARDMRRYWFSGAEEIELDTQGRVVIPAPLLKYADIQQEVMIIGAGDHFEIWDSTKWQQLISRLEERIH